MRSPTRLSTRFLGVLAGAFLVAGLACAEKPSDHAWQAQWIGPAPRMDLQGAFWIWTDEPGADPLASAPSGARFFRRGIEIKGGAVIQQAIAAFAADNHFKLRVNGRVVGGGDDWQNPVELDITSALKPGLNEITVQADNDPASGSVNAAGLIGKIRIEQGDGAVREIVTDASWGGSMNATAPPSKPARVLGGVGTAPWSALRTTSGGAPRNLWTCYRKGFTLTQAPATALARIAVDSKYWLWVNGRMAVREGGLKRGPNPHDTYFDVVDLAPLLKQGDNTIAVLAWYWGKDGFSHKSSGKPGFLFEMEAGGARILSDPSWRTLRHPAFGEAGNTPNFRLPESSVHFDARQDPSGWLNPGFDDDAWPAASGFGKPPTAPWNRLWQREIPSGRISASRTM